MGLDMYAYTTTADIPSVDFDMHSLPCVRIHYWCKYPNLHGWMKCLYHERGGADMEFNCATLRLTPQDLDRLERDVRIGALPYTCGFFFGESQLTSEERDDDLEFIAAAREALAAGLSVFYTSWW